MLAFCRAIFARQRCAMSGLWHCSIKSTLVPHHLPSSGESYGLAKLMGVHEYLAGFGAAFDGGLAYGVFACQDGEPVP